MAYIGTDRYMAVWTAGDLHDDALADSCIHLLGAEDEAEGSQTSSEESRGFIIEDWFGPFLLGPQSRFLRGRC
jgi:hypothetical protein